MRRISIIGPTKMNMFANNSKQSRLGDTSVNQSELRIDNEQ